MANKINVAGELFAATTDGIIADSGQVRLDSGGNKVSDLGQYQYNPEYLRVVTDAEDRILVAIKNDGKLYLPKNETYQVETSPEWLAVWVDSDEKVLFGIKTDGTTYVAKSEFQDKLNEIEEIIGQFDTSTITQQIIDLQNDLNDVQEDISDIKTQIEEINTSSGAANQFLSSIDDPENRLEITTDKNEKVLSYRTDDGINHEVIGFDSPKYYQNGEEKDWVDKSGVAGEVTKAAENGAIKLENVEGVSNHNTPNLLIADEMEKTFNDGTNSFTPPNAGYEMSNPIECKAGDWFTRTGTATGMVVVTDENDKNGTRLFNADGTTLGSTFQIPTDMTWVRYIRMAADVTGAENGTTVICKGKYAYIGENKGDYLTVSKLRIEKRNLSKEVAYIKSEDGLKFYELYVDSTGTLKTKEIDPDLIPESEYPANWLPITFSGSFEGHCDRIPLLTNRYIMDIKAGGPTKILSFSPELITEKITDFPTIEIRDGKIVQPENFFQRFSLGNGVHVTLDTTDNSEIIKDPSPNEIYISKNGVQFVKGQKLELMPISKLLGTDNVTITAQNVTDFVQKTADDMIFILPIFVFLIAIPILFFKYAILIYVLALFSYLATLFSPLSLHFESRMRLATVSAIPVLVFNFLFATVFGLFDLGIIAGVLITLVYLYFHLSRLRTAQTGK